MKKQTLTLLFLALGLRLFSQSYDSFEEMKEGMVSKTVPLISVEEFRKIERTKNSFLILDAREKDEYEVSHIKNAKYVGYDDFKIERLMGANKETTIFIYCSVGYRSEKVGEKLKREGYKNVFNLKGGIFDWVNSGYPLYNKEKKETSKIHPYNDSWGRWLTKGEKGYE